MSDSIDADLLDYYQRELTWLRHAGGASPKRYPKVARRLQLAPANAPTRTSSVCWKASRCSPRAWRLDDDYAGSATPSSSSTPGAAPAAVLRDRPVRTGPDPGQPRRGLPAAARHRAVRHHPRRRRRAFPQRRGDFVAAGDRRGDPARRRGGASPDRSRRRPLGVAPEPALPGRVPLGRTVDRAPAHPPGSFADGLRDLDLLAAHAVQVMARAPARRGTPQDCRRSSASPPTSAAAGDGGHPAACACSPSTSPSPTSSTSSTCRCPARSPTDERSTWSSIAHRRHACICRRKTPARLRAGDQPLSADLGAAARTAPASTAWSPTVTARTA